MPGDGHHIRGCFFEKYPKLIEKEISRRHNSNKVRNALESSGFKLANEVQLRDTRRVYHNLEALSVDLIQRTGRSILYVLTDVELRELSFFIKNKLKDRTLPIIKIDSWILWFAIKQ